LFNRPVVPVVTPGWPGPAKVCKVEHSEVA